MKSLWWLILVYNDGDIYRVAMDFVLRDVPLSRIPHLGGSPAGISSG